MNAKSKSQILKDINKENQPQPELTPTGEKKRKRKKSHQGHLSLQAEEAGLCCTGNCNFFIWDMLFSEKKQSGQRKWKRLQRTINTFLNLLLKLDS